MKPQSNKPFCCNNIQPDVILGENLFLTDEYVAREYYTEVPANDLKVPGAQTADYVKSVLESWSNGALVFDGKTRYAVLANADMKSDYKRSVVVHPKYSWKTNKAKTPYPGDQRKTVDMDINNFLIECYLKTTPDHTGGALVNKTGADAGYRVGIHADGGVVLTVLADGKTIEVKDIVKVNDGKWHHVVVEMDRKTQTVGIYVNGKQVTTKKVPLDPTVSLANTGDFLVGNDTKDAYFSGALDFLRVCRGTLKDAETTIEELYAWEFDGPFLKDFTGQTPADGKRDAGAIDYRK